MGLARSEPRNERGILVARWCALRADSQSSDAACATVRPNLPMLGRRESREPSPQTADEPRLFLHLGSVHVQQPSRARLESSLPFVARWAWGSDAPWARSSGSHLAVGEPPQRHAVSALRRLPLPRRVGGRSTYWCPHCQPEPASRSGLAGGGRPLTSKRHGRRPTIC